MKQSTNPVGFWFSLVLIVGAAKAAAKGQLLWTIGTADGSYQEFALAGNHGEYPATFPQDVTFTVGESDPARDWSFIQPGPADPWAGGRPHPFRIEFDLDQAVAGDALLTVDLVNTHWGNPPTLEVDVNGHRRSFPLPPGASDESLTNPAVGQAYLVNFPFPGDWLSVGRSPRAVGCFTTRCG